MGRKPGLFSELKRRRVFRVAVVYAVVGFVVAQVADLLFPALLLPEWAFRLVVLLLILGFPIALVLAWSFDLTPEGVRRTDPGSGGADEGAGAEPGTEGSPAARASARPRLAAAAGFTVLLAALGFGAYHLLVGGEESGPAVGIASAPTGVYSIAVLPLTNLVGGEENEYFADGITEDLLTNLGLVPDFTVISRTSAMRYKGSDKSVPEIARELGVQFVLEGSLRRSGDRVRVVIQLVEPGTDTQIWAQTLDRRVEDIFDVQSEIAQAVVSALRVELTGGVSDRIGRAPTDNFDAYELFLQGRDLYYDYSGPAMERAIELFRRAVELDPNFALAHAWLGASHAVHAFNNRADPGLYAYAEEHARRAIRLQPDLGDGWRALGTTLGVTGRYDEAASALERAIELNPHDFPAIGNLGLVYALQGVWDRAIEMVLISIRRDPTRSYIDYANLAGYALRLSLFDWAVESANQSLELRPRNEIALGILAMTAFFRGRTAEAVERAERLARDHDEDAQGLDAAGTVLLLAGEEASARAALERLHEMAPHILPQQSHAPPVLLAYLLDKEGETDRAAGLLRASERLTREAIDAGDRNPALEFSLAGIAAVRGERSRALDHLERAVEMGWNEPDLTRRDPVLAPLGEDPRFVAAVERMQARTDAMRERVERQRRARP